MSETTLLVLGALELAGVIGVFAIGRRNARRRAEAKPRPPKWARAATAVLLLLVVLGFPALLIMTAMSPTVNEERLHKQLVEDGIPATATITSVEDTGVFVNRRPKVRLRLSVEPEGGPAFSSQSTWVFSTKDVQTYVVGTRVNVFYDPEEPGTVAVVGVAR